MKTPLLVLAALFFAATTHCFALMGIEYVSRERARELGIEIRITENGPNDVWVKLEFKAEGALKEFDHVSLEIRDGEKFLLGYASQKTECSSSGVITVHFLANRAFLEKVILSVVTGFPSNFGGHELKLKDFIEAEKVR